jgi:hypothetical protein
MARSCPIVTYPESAKDRYPQHFPESFTVLHLLMNCLLLTNLSTVRQLSLGLSAAHYEIFLDQLKPAVNPQMTMPTFSAIQPLLFL